MSASSVRAALHSAQLLTGLSKPGASLTPLLGARVVHLIDRAAIQLLHFIAHQGAPAKKGVSFALESREDRALAKAEPKLPTESSTKGWYGVTAASAREQSLTKAGQLETGSQTPQLTAPQTLALTSATLSATAHQNGQSGISGANGASLMRTGTSAYTEGLASDVYRLGEALARYVALRVGETMDQIQRHVTGGPPPPELPTSETLHALQVGFPFKSTGLIMGNFGFLPIFVSFVCVFLLLFSFLRISVSSRLLHFKRTLRYSFWSPNGNGKLGRRHGSRGLPPPKSPTRENGHVRSVSRFSPGMSTTVPTFI
jgi:hypothetical protein